LGTCVLEQRLSADYGSTGLLSRKTAPGGA
jgi:hypothetical protein